MKVECPTLISKMQRLSNVSILTVFTFAMQNIGVSLRPAAIPGASLIHQKTKIADRLRIISILDSTKKIL